MFDEDEETDDEVDEVEEGAMDEEESDEEELVVVAAEETEELATGTGSKLLLCSLCGAAEAESSMGVASRDSPKSHSLIWHVRGLMRTFDVFRSP